MKLLKYHIGLPRLFREADCSYRQGERRTHRRLMPVTGPPHTVPESPSWRGAGSIVPTLSPLQRDGGEAYSVGHRQPPRSPRDEPRLCGRTVGTRIYIKICCTHMNIHIYRFDIYMEVEGIDRASTAINATTDELQAISKYRPVKRGMRRET